MSVSHSSRHSPNSYVRNCTRGEDDHTDFEKLCEGPLPDLYLLASLAALTGCRVSSSSSGMDEAFRSFCCKRQMSLLGHSHAAEGPIEVKLMSPEEAREILVLHFSIMD